MKKLSNKLTSVLMAAALFAAAIPCSASELDATKCEAYINQGGTKNNINMLRMLKDGTIFEMTIDNNTEADAEVSMLLVKFDGDICKGVMIADAVTVAGNDTAKVSIKTKKSDFTGIDAIKCIAVQNFNGGMYPVDSDVYQLSGSWSTINTLQ